MSKRRLGIQFMKIRWHGSKSERPIDVNPLKTNQIASLEPISPEKHIDLDHSKISQLLIAEGFSQEQTDALILLISQAVGESMKNMIQSLALKNDQQFVRQHNQAQFDKLQSDINDLGMSNKFNIKAKRILRFSNQN